MIEFFIGVWVSGAVITWFGIGNEAADAHGFVSAVLACFLWPIVAMWTLGRIWRDQ